MGKVCHELLKTDFGGHSLEDIERRLRRDWQWTGEVRHSRKDGTPLFVACKLTLDINKLFDFTIVTEVNNNITGLKLAESRFGKIAGVNHLVWEISPDGEVTYVNRCWREYLGRELSRPTTAADLLGTVEHPEDALKSAQRWHDGFQSGEMEPWESRLRGYDGLYRWFVCRAVAVRNGTGQIKYWVGTATEIA
jgi:PAS domain-containing protein